MENQVKKSDFCTVKTFLGKKSLPSHTLFLKQEENIILKLKKNVVQKL